ncbi:MAG: hypothetical protein ACYC9O_02990, partial [Candidatus Latescibacterota bacterium]
RRKCPVNRLAGWLRQAQPPGAELVEAHATRLYRLDRVLGKSTKSNGGAKNLSPLQKQNYKRRRQRAEKKKNGSEREPDMEYDYQTI